MIKLLTVTWSKRDAYNIKKTPLYRSFIKNNNEKDLIHMHFNRLRHLFSEAVFRARFGEHYTFLIYKIYLLRKKIKDIKADHIIFADALDVACLDCISRIEPPEEILFGSEISQYPSDISDWGGLGYLESDRKNRHFLNSGLFIAKKESYLKLLDSVIEKILPLNLKSFAGDQGVYTYHYLSNHEPIIKLDTESKLFLNTFRRGPRDYEGKKLPIFVHDNGWRANRGKFIDIFKLAE